MGRSIRKNKGEMAQGKGKNGIGSKKTCVEEK